LGYNNYLIIKDKYRNLFNEILHFFLIDYRLYHFYKHKIEPRGFPSVSNFSLNNF